jgi:hypothetical protein
MKTMYNDIKTMYNDIKTWIVSQLQRLLNFYNECNIYVVNVAIQI